MRSPEKATDLTALGVQVREADYSKPETLVKAFSGADKVLLISSSEVGAREAQHKAVIDAAKTAGVNLLAYTSLLHADTTPMGLGTEHRATEQALIASGVPYAILRNGWYTENYAAVSLRRWRITPLSARQVKAKSPPRAVRIMPTPPPLC